MPYQLGFISRVTPALGKYPKREPLGRGELKIFYCHSNNSGKVLKRIQSTIMLTTENNLLDQTIRQLFRQWTLYPLHWPSNVLYPILSTN